MVPAVLDVLSTVMMNASLIIIPVSFWQVMRGSLIVFTAFFTICFRHKKLLAVQWVGIILVSVAFIIIGATLILSENVSIGKKSNNNNETNS